jgi:hypothetical protein
MKNAKEGMVSQSFFKFFELGMLMDDSSLALSSA